MTNGPYNPLDKLNLAKSIELEILNREPVPLAETASIVGSGVYALYYTGMFPPYEMIAKANSAGAFTRPIYVGKAIPAGGRKGGLNKNASLGTSLRKRLAQHARSIDEVANLDKADFFVRFLVVDDVWIPLGENALIETFQPLWNRAIDGFGNNPAGKGRKDSVKSPWDMLHDGRKRAKEHKESASVEFFEKRVADYLAGRPMDTLPKAVREQIKKDRSAAEEGADDA